MKIDRIKTIGFILVNTVMLYILMVVSRTIRRASGTYDIKAIIFLYYYYWSDFFCIRITN